MWWKERRDGRWLTVTLQTILRYKLGQNLIQQIASRERSQGSAQRDPEHFLKNLGWSLILAETKEKVHSHLVATFKSEIVIGVDSALRLSYKL
jgi:predicted solute-binding protein